MGEIKLDGPSTAVSKDKLVFLWKDSHDKPEIDNEASANLDEAVLGIRMDVQQIDNICYGAIEIQLLL
jgi:hypothetical protein